MIQKTFIKADEITHCSISVSWDIDQKINVASIKLKLIKHSFPVEDLGIVLISSKAVGYDLLSLSPETIYEIQVAPLDARRQYSWSNILICTTLALPHHELYYDSEKIVKTIPMTSTEIINSRNLKNWKEYVSCGYKFAQPKELRQELIHRTLTWANAIDKLQDKYSLKDDYFQGPFVCRPLKNQNLRK